MKKIHFLTLILLALLFSCDSNSKISKSETKNSDNPIVVTIDLSDLKIGGSIAQAVTGNAEFQLKGLDLSDGVVIIDGNTSRSLTIENDDSGNNSLFKREDGTFIPVPDKDREALFYDSDISSLESTTIYFKKLKLNNDFKIDLDEYPGRNGVEEEFYYLDFSSPEWQNLDRSEVVFWLGGVGHCSYSLIHWSTMREGYNSRKIFDLSDPCFDSGLGIDLYAVLTSTSSDQCYRLYVCNPIELEENEDISIDGSCALNIFKVQASKNSEKNYKVILSFSKDDYSKLNYRSFHTCARYNDGTMRDNELIPFFDEKNSTVELEVGKIDSDFIFNLDFSYNDADEFPSYTIRLTESERTEIYSSLKTEADNTFVAYDSTNKQTIAFKTGNGWPAEVKWSDKVSCVEAFCSGKNGEGTGFSEGSVTLLENMNYCYIVTLKEGVEHEAGDVLFTISPRSNINLKCNVKYNENKYECKGCENCDFKGFVLKMTDINEHMILQGAYQTSEPLETKYGRIEYIDGKFIKNDSSISLNSTTTGSYDGQAFGTLAMNGNDVKKDSIEIRVIEIRPSDKTIVADITIDDKTKYKKVVMNYKEHHSWFINDDKTVKCTECGEIRNSARIEIKKNEQYYMNANEDFYILVENMSDVEYGYMAGTNLKAPVAPSDITARLIPSASGKQISYNFLVNNKIEIKIE